MSEFNQIFVKTQTLQYEVWDGIERSKATHMAQPSRPLSWLFRGSVLGGQSDRWRVTDVAAAIKSRSRNLSSHLSGRMSKFWAKTTNEVESFYKAGQNYLCMLTEINSCHKLKHKNKLLPNCLNMHYVTERQKTALKCHLSSLKANFSQHTVWPSLSSGIHSYGVKNKIPYCRRAT